MYVSGKDFIAYVLFLCIVGSCLFRIGYGWQRDLELESTKPVVFKYEITYDAAKLLVLKGQNGLECSK